jgi:hypothetical protein
LGEKYVYIYFKVTKKVWKNVAFVRKLFSLRWNAIILKKYKGGDQNDYPLEHETGSIIKVRTFESHNRYYHYFLESRRLTYV